MMKRTKRLLFGLMMGLGLAAALLIAGCDGDDLAQAAGASGAGALSGQRSDEASAPESSGMTANAPEPDVAGPPSEGASPAAPSVISLASLIDNIDDYDGQLVVVRGKILTQCIRGCRFTLDDGSGTIYIELVDEALENVLMTGSVGRTVEVRGLVTTSPRAMLFVENRDGWNYVD